MRRVNLQRIISAGRCSGNYKSLISALKVLTRGVLLTPLIVLMIFFCGNCALPGSVIVTHADTRSYLQAEYGPWGFLSIGAIKEQIVSEIRSDMILLRSPGNALLDPSPGAGSFLAGTVEINQTDLKSSAVEPPVTDDLAAAKPKGTVSEQPDIAVTVTQITEDTETPTAVHSPTPSRTVIPTQTQTAANPISPPPAATATPAATSTPRPTTTVTATITSTATVTATITSTATATITETATPNFTSTAAPTSTSTPAETEVTAGNTFWFSDQNVISDAFLMFPIPQTSSASQNTAGYVSFETEDFQSGSSIDGGIATVYVYATNIYPSDRTIDVSIHRGWTTLGSGQAVIPGSSTVPLLLSFSFPTSGAVLQGEGKFLMADFLLEGGVRIYWAGNDFSESRIAFPNISPP